MKILLTVHQFLPEYYAGTEILTFNTAKVLQSLGHEVSVFCGFFNNAQLADADRFDSYEYDGIPVTRFHHDFVPMGEQQNIVELEHNNLLFARYFRTHLIALRPDIVHSFHLQRLSASAIDVCHDLDIPMVLTPTDFWFVCFTNQLRLPDNATCRGPDRNSVNCLRHMVTLTQSPNVVALLKKLPDWLVAAIIWLLNKGVLPRYPVADQVRALSCRPFFLIQRLNMVDRVIAPTRLMESILTGRGLRPEKVVYNPFGINLAHIRHTVRARPDGKLVIGFIGTLYEHKGPHVLVAALRSLAGFKPVELRIYGKTDEYPDYVEELKKSVGNDERISFCGTFPYEEIGNVFAKLDVLAVPSIWHENTPLVIYSALAAGCPVIASDMGGISEVIRHEVNGLLCEPGNAVEFAAAIRRLAIDRILLQKLSENCKTPKSIQEYVEELAVTYRQVISEKAAELLVNNESGI